MADEPSSAGVAGSSESRSMQNG